MSTIKNRIFLCVIDHSAEMKNALRYAARRAEAIDGNVGLFYCIEPNEFQHWVSVGNIMEQEAIDEAHDLFDKATAYVEKISHKEPFRYLHQGNLFDELYTLLSKAEMEYSVLVLGAGLNKKDGPGPIISHFISKMAHKLPIPMTVVPGHYSEKDIDRISMYRKEE